MALETLTEPHKLTATLHAVVSVSRFVEMKLINPCCNLIGAESSHWLDLAHSSSFTTLADTKLYLQQELHPFLDQSFSPILTFKYHTTI